MLEPYLARQCLAGTALQLSIILELTSNKSRLGSNIN
jgi:hypothetical protein